MAMHFTKKMTVFPLFLLLSSCASTPTAPTPVPEVRVNPVAIHLSVNESQVFTFSGGDGNFNFSFSPNIGQFANIERLGSNSIKVTYLREKFEGNKVPAVSYLTVSSKGKKAESSLYFNRG